MNNFVASFSAFGSSGSGSGQLAYAEGVAADGLGDVFVADADNDRIVLLSSVPEPSALAMMTTGLLTVLAAGARRRRVRDARRPWEKG